MKAKAFAFGAIYNAVFSLILASVCTLSASIVGGHPITPAGFAVSFAQGFVMAWVIGMVFPIEKMGKTFAHAVGAQTRCAESILSALICGTFFFVVLNFAFTVINTGFATFMVNDMPITFMDRYMDGFLEKWLYVIAAVIMTNPLAFSVAHKMTGFPPVEAHA